MQITEEIHFSVLTLANRNALMEQHDPLALFLAKKWFQMYVTAGMTVNDFIQTARLGLLKAIDTYMDFRQASFATWAAYKIKAEIQAELIKTKTIVRVPHRKCKIVSIVQDMRETIIDEIEDHADYRTISQFEDECDAAVLMKDLTADEKTAVMLRYYEGATYKEIGEVFNDKTHEWARLLIKNANYKMAQVGVSPCHKCNYHDICRDNNIKICPRDGKRTHYLDAKDE